MHGHGWIISRTCPTIDFFPVGRSLRTRGVNKTELVHAFSGKLLKRGPMLPDHRIRCPVLRCVQTFAGAVSQDSRHTAATVGEISRVVNSEPFGGGYKAAVEPRLNSKLLAYVSRC